MKDKRQIAMKYDLYRQAVFIEGKIKVKQQQIEEFLQIFFEENYRKIRGFKMQNNLALKLLKQTSNTWKNIVEINGNSYYCYGSNGKNKIGDKGCKYLSQAEFPMLKILCLQKCSISDIGMSHLSKAKFDRLAILSISQSIQIRQLFFYLNKSSWNNLKYLKIDYQIHSKQNEFNFKILLLSQIKNLSQFHYTAYNYQTYKKQKLMKVQLKQKYVNIQIY